MNRKVCLKAVGWAGAFILAAVILQATPARAESGRADPGLDLWRFVIMLAIGGSGWAGARRSGQGSGGSGAAGPPLLTPGERIRCPHCETQVLPSGAERSKGQMICYQCEKSIQLGPG
jgi:hypothetical protein